MPRSREEANPASRAISGNPNHRIGTATNRDSLCCRITQSTLRSTISDTATFNLTPSITTEGRYTPYSNSAPDTYCLIVSVLRSDDTSTGNDAGASWYLS